MKVVIISDTHCQHDSIELPDGDILIHAGDSTYEGTIKQISSFGDWLKKQAKRFRHILFIAGNHDDLFQNDRVLAMSLTLAPNVYYLEDSIKVIDGIRFYGSPWQPWYYDFAFQPPKGKSLKDKWDCIPDGTDVLITHGPPYGIRDLTDRTNEQVGDRDLLEAVQKIKPKIHIFGHIHEGYGIDYNTDTIFVNASTCNRQYRPINPPIMLDI